MAINLSEENFGNRLCGFDLQPGRAEGYVGKEIGVDGGATLTGLRLSICGLPRVAAALRGNPGLDAINRFAVFDPR